MKIPGGASLAAVALWLGWAAPATAQETTHGCACFHNKTTALVSYRYKWGEAAWQAFQLKPNFSNWLCWKYDNAQKSSPNLTFQLDVDTSKGSAWTTYAIKRVQTAGASCNAVGRGGHYDITYRPNTNNTFIQVTNQP
ncbi:hypothetical protein BH11PSE3_BH11PSE3_33570 [soil metagenome]